MIRTQIQLTKVQAIALKRIAAEKSVSMAELVREGVDAVIKNVPGLTESDIRERALKPVGKFHSGLGDLAEKHDEYLEEAWGQ